MGTRPFFGILLLCLSYCAPIEPEGVELDVPDADAEGAGVSLQLKRPGARLVIRADSVREYSERQMAVAMGRVRLSFFDGAGQAGAALSARRMYLDHRSGTIEMAGDVVLVGTDSVTVFSDSLRWESEGERLSFPGALRVELAEGVESGRDLETNSSVDAWVVHEVNGRWNWGEDEVEIRAERERSQHLESGLQVRYEGVELRVASIDLHSALAHWMPDDRQLVLDGGVEGIDSSGAFSAQQIAIDVDRRVLEARGRVRAVRDDARLQATEWTEHWEEHRSHMRGDPARYERNARRIEAADLSYERDLERVEASGAVEFSEGARRLGARHMLYDHALELLTADGGVSIKAAEWEGTLRGERLGFDLDAERGWLVGAPQLHSRDENDLRIEADSMHFDMQQKRLDGEGRFRLASGSVQMQSERGYYASAEEQVGLLGDVVLWEGGGDTLASYRIAADSMTVQLSAGVATQVRVGGALNGRVKVGRESASWLAGRHGLIVLQDDQLREIALESEADVTYHQIERDEVSRFRGDRMVLYFADERLYQVRVEGSAVLESRLVRAEDQVAANRVEGDEMDIYFVAGALSSVEVGPQIEGTYVPEGDEAP